MIIDGKAIAASIRQDLKERVALMDEKPGLAVVLVGENPASQVYVRMKRKACEETGMRSDMHMLPAETTQEQLLELLQALNAADSVHGILVQLPLPDHIDELAIIEAIDPRKDVDGFHPVNVGKLLSGYTDGFGPCTPLGCQELIARTVPDLKGKHCVIVGRSNIVGKPLAALMVQKSSRANCIVTICHSAAPDLSVYTRSADILVAAVGRPGLITADMVKPGAVVIDVGINRVDDASAERGYRLVGDVAFDEVSAVASAITPVPGGVGPMTIAMLLENTLKAFNLSR